MHMMQLDTSEPTNKMAKQQASASSQGNRHTLQPPGAPAPPSAGSPLCAPKRLALLAHQLSAADDDDVVVGTSSNSFSSCRCCLVG
jgi:hypothetical protein